MIMTTFYIEFPRLNGKYAYVSASLSRLSQHLNYGHIKNVLDVRDMEAFIVKFGNNTMQLRNANHRVEIEHLLYHAYDILNDIKYTGDNVDVRTSVFNFNEESSTRIMQGYLKKYYDFLIHLEIFQESFSQAGLFSR